MTNIIEYDTDDYDKVKETMSNENVIDLLQRIRRGYIPDYEYNGSAADLDHYKLHIAIFKAIDALNQVDKYEKMHKKTQNKQKSIVNIEINNFDKSYLGKDIKDWCKNNPDDPKAKDIFDKYYSEYVKFRPADNVYYFIEYMTSSESYKECGSLNMAGCRLHRDLDKSPRRKY